MASPEQDLERRRPVWDALSRFFLDTELSEEDYRQIAETIVASSYMVSEVQGILWEEVYPVLRTNLCSPAGVWDGFDQDWLEEKIVAGKNRRTLRTRLARALPSGPTRAIRKEWDMLLPYLPQHLRHEPASGRAFPNR